MIYYPVYLNLSGKAALVVGAGRVALRKTRGLIEAGARVTVVAPERAEGFESLDVRWVQRRFRASDVQGHGLVFAATDDRKVNHRVAEAARRAGIPVNVADSREECDFIVPARIRRGDLQLAVSTSGRNPRIAASIRRKIEEILEAAPL